MGAAATQCMGIRDPLLVSRDPLSTERAGTSLKRAGGQTYSSSVGEQDAGRLSQEQLSTLFSSRGGWRCLLPIPISLSDAAFVSLSQHTGQEKPPG